MGEFFERLTTFGTYTRCEQYPAEGTEICWHGPGYGLLLVIGCWFATLFLLNAIGFFKSK